MSSRSKQQRRLPQLVALSTSTAVSISMALFVAACGSEKAAGGNVPAPAPAPQPAPPPPPPPPAKVSTLGINLTVPAYWTGERAFKNLTIGGHWYSVRPGQPWVQIPQERLDAGGAVRALEQGEEASLYLTPPAHKPDGVTIRCTYQGSGTLAARGAATQITASGKTIEFNWRVNYPVPDGVWLQMSTSDPGDPIRNVDCRELNATASRFDAEFLNFFAAFRHHPLHGLATNQ